MGTGRDDHALGVEDAAGGQPTPTAPLRRRHGIIPDGAAIRRRQAPSPIPPARSLARHRRPGYVGPAPCGRESSAGRAMPSNLKKLPLWQWGLISIFAALASNMLTPMVLGPDDLST